jgi:hypothetical protein
MGKCRQQWHAHHAWRTRAGTRGDQKTREMGFMRDNSERLLRFHVLYSAVLKQEFDREEFVADDLYAFQALERALRSGNQELRNLAAHLQAQRQAEMESITLKSTEPLDSTRRMSSLSLADSAVSVAAAASGEDQPLLPEAELDDRPATSATPEAERRSGEHRLSPQEITRVTYLQRLYRQEFGKPLNLARFTMDDSYGREVLKEALGAQNRDLVAIARFFIDEHGKPRQHRRGIDSTAAM